MISLERCQEIATELSAQYNLPGVLVTFNKHMSTTWGKCYWLEQRIDLNYKFCQLNSEDVVRDLIKHELAHLKVPNHGEEFVGVCKEMGIPKHTYEAHPEAIQVAKYEYCCEVCGKRVYSNIKTIASCKSCSDGLFNPKYVLSVRKNPNIETTKRINVRRRSIK